MTTTRTSTSDGVVGVGPADPNGPLAEYLTARLRGLPDTAQPRSAASADLALLSRLRRSATSDRNHVTLVDRQRHRLMLDVAQRYGWTSDPDFLAEWLLPASPEERPLTEVEAALRA